MAHRFLDHSVDITLKDMNMDHQDGAERNVCSHACTFISPSGDKFASRGSRWLHFESTVLEQVAEWCLVCQEGGHGLRASQVNPKDGYKGRKEGISFRYLKVDCLRWSALGYLFFGRQSCNLKGRGSTLSVYTTKLYHKTGVGIFLYRYS